MRKVIAELAVSLDGFIEGKKGELDWLVFDEEPAFVNGFLSRFEVIFYGRVAYQKFGAHLDFSTSGDFAGYNYTLSAMRKYVFTRSRKHVEGNGMVINSRIRENVSRIKEEEGKDIWLCGGARIISTFAQMNLIDEYVLAIHPVVLGSGKPLFGNIHRRIELELLQAERLQSGVVILNYRPSPVKINKAFNLPELKNIGEAVISS